MVKINKVLARILTICLAMFLTWGIINHTEAVEWWELNNGCNVKDFGAVGNGNANDTAAIQAAIDAAANGPLLVYFPTGTYRVTSELKVWQSIQLRGDYSRVRPTILLKVNTPGYNNPSNPAYVLKFYETSTERAWTGTFASQIDGINIMMQSGNNGAIGMWFTAAQSSGASNCRIVMDGNLMGIQGLPGISVNENLEFEGGRVGLKLHSGVWPFVLKGCTFNNQTFAAIEGESSGGAGTGVVLEGCYIKNCPIGIYIPEWMWSSERLYLEDCAFENISSGKAIVGSHGDRVQGDWQIAMKNTYFKDVAYISYWEDGSALPIDGYLLGWCRADYVTHGNRWENGVQMDTYRDNHREVTYNPSFTGLVPIKPADYVDYLPNKSNCVNVENYGAYGNDSLDDTTSIRNAIAANPTTPIWFPIGVYKVTDTILLQKDTKLIGEHCKNTRVDLVLADTSFNNPTNPKPIFDTVDDPTGTAIFAHFSFGEYFDNTNTPEIEYDGMINIRWRVGRNSMIYDMYSLNGDGYGGIGQRGYACLVITGSGGGHIKQIWAPWNNVSAPGSLYINGTHEPLMLYGMGFEHSRYKPFIYISDAYNVICRSIQAEANAGIIEAHRSHNLVFNNIYYNAGYYDVEPIAMQFYDCHNIELYCYWRYWNTYYSTGLLYQAGNNYLTIPDNGFLGMAAFNQAGIVASWKMDGDVLDTSGNGHDGILFGNPQYVNGIRGSGLEFDGLGDYIGILDSTAWDLGSAFTVELWFKTTQSIAEAGLLVQADLTYGNGWSLFINSNRVYWQYYTDGPLWMSSDAFSLGSSMVLNDGRWHYIVVTNNGGISNLYIDGTKDDTATQLSIRSASVPLYIGTIYDRNQDFPGTIDSVTIYDTTPSDSEIQSRYASGGF